MIVADGGSGDGTVAMARKRADQVLLAAPGRARQMNAGAKAASGDVLLFLHADTRLPADADQRILQAVSAGDGVWGRFDIELSGSHWLFPTIAAMMNVRSCLTGMVTGDQGMFVTATAFASVGGFPDIPLMEDIEISRALKRCSRPACLRPSAVTSSRRWEQYGVLRTVFQMWSLRFSYALGGSPERLANIYYGRTNTAPR